MISDADLYRLAIFLGSAAMLLIVLYHFLEVNAVEELEHKKAPIAVPAAGDIKNGAAIR
jgi:oligosaccharyl transferase complex subunit OST4